MLGNLSLRIPFLIHFWRLRLWVARVAGRLGHWATSEGRPAAFVVVVLIATVIAALLEPILWMTVLAEFGLLLILWAIRARRSMAIDDFSDQTARKDLPVGAATLLAIELAQIGDLFRVVDERNTLQTTVGEYTPLEAAVKVDELTDVIRTSVTAETKMKIGPIEIPIGTGMIIFGRLVQGPRLRCQVHEIGDQLVLSAQLSGRRVSPAWRIERTLEAATPSARALALNDMLPELACRLFTNLGFRRKVKWRAMRSFTEALRTYRSCLRTPKDRAVKLLRAQQHLVQALAADEDFVLVYYNLGVVYSELSRLASRANRRVVALRHRQAAERAFTKAVEHDPTRWESYYALARLNYERRALVDARDLCHRVLTLSARRGGEMERAKAHDLIAHWDDKNITGDTLRHRRKASRSALRALTRGHLQRRAAGSEDDRVPTLRDLAANCIANLALDEAKHHEPKSEERPLLGWRLWRAWARQRRIVALFKLAQRLTTKSANLHYELGRIATERRDYRLAVRELENATRTDPERAVFWGQLARAHCGRLDSREAVAAAKAACQRAEATANLLELKPNSDQDTAIRDVIKAWEALGSEEEKRRLEEQRAFAIDVTSTNPGLGRGDLNASGVATRCDQKRTWQAAHLAIVLGREKLNEPRNGEPDPALEAEDLLRTAIAILDGDRALASGVTNNELRGALERALPDVPSGGEIDEARELSRGVIHHDLRASLARALALQGKNDEALEEAEKAVSRNPLSSVAFDALGHVFNASADFQGARTAWKQALLLSPDEAMLHWELGFCCWRLAIEASAFETRRALLEEAREHLTSASELFAYEEFEHRVRVHYWLARVYEELGDSANVIPSLRLVQASRTLNCVADFLMAQAYRRLRRFNKAERLYEEVIHDTKGASGAEVGKDDVIEIWPDEILAERARCALAMSYAERGAGPDKATAVLEKVSDKLEPLREKAEENGYSAPFRQLEGAYLHASGRVALAEDRLDDAMRDLQASINIRAHPEVYLDLAIASWQRACDPREPDPLAHVERAQRYCELVAATDARASCVEKLAELLPELDLAKVADRRSRIQQSREAKEAEPGPGGGNGENGEGSGASGARAADMDEWLLAQLRQLLRESRLQARKSASSSSPPGRARKSRSPASNRSGTKTLEPSSTKQSKARRQKGAGGGKTS